MADGLGTTPGDSTNISMPPQVDDDFFDNLHTDQVKASDAPLPTETALVEGGPDNKPTDSTAGDQSKVDAAPAGDDKPPEVAKTEGADAPPAIVEPPPVTPVADPELSPAENAMVQALPEAERAEAAARLKTPTFVSQFKDPGNPIVETLTEMDRLSPARSAALKAEVLTQQLADPAAFARDLFSRDPELFGKVAIAIEDGHPDFWVKRHTGVDDATTDELRAAIPFYRANKDRVAELQAVVPEFTDDELKSLDEFHPDINASERIKQLLDMAKANAQPGTSGLTSEEKTELVKLRAEQQAKLAADKPDPKEAAQVADLELATRYDNIAVEGMRFVHAKLDDPAGGYGLKVTDEERTLAPDVANFKDDKRDILLRGAGEMPPFEKGFEKFAEGLTVKDANGIEKNPVFEIARAVIYFIEHGEFENAKEEERKLNPYKDKYLEQRLAHPRIKWIDSQIQSAIAKTGKKPPVETFVPGATAAPSGKAQETYDDIMDNFVPTR